MKVFVSDPASHCGNVVDVWLFDHWSRFRSQLRFLRKSEGAAQPVARHGFRREVKRAVKFATSDLEQGMVGNLLTGGHCSSCVFGLELDWSDRQSVCATLQRFQQHGIELTPRMIVPYCLQVYVDIKGLSDKA